MCFATQQNPTILGINENKYFQSCHASRDNTRAGFKSAPMVSVETGCSSITEYVWACTSVDAAHTKQSSLILTFNKKTRALERSCALSQEGAISPILREICPHKKTTPKSGRHITAITGILLTAFMLWRQYLHHFWGAFFTGAFLPQKLVLAPPLERQYKPFQ
jgi:hypothetical protein